MLRLAFSNRFETLLDGLVHALADAPASPFGAQHVVVPSMAIRRTIELTLADRLGICANVEFSFLGAWLWRQMGRLIDVADDSPFAPEVLAWRVWEIFGDANFVGRHSPLQKYLSGADALMRYELALRVAKLFDQYLTYRPDWLAEWSGGRSVSLRETGNGGAADERWQAALWRRIAREAGASAEHPSTMFFAAMERGGAAGVREAGIPAQAHVFCLPTMPPLYLAMLRQLGRYVDLRLSVHNPCREFWFDIVDARRLRYLAACGRLDHHEMRNPLLASWGKQRQSQLAMLFDDGGDAVVDDDCFEPSGGTALLARVQNAILDLTELPPGTLHPIAPDDRSIEIHICHSRTRELEALHDFLLARFADDPGLHPSDVLVVTPRLDEAAPLIDAVFGTASGARRIPYTITGRGASQANAAARALLDILALATSRFHASDVFELLQQPIVARHFGIDAPALDSIREWIRESGVRWGVDAQHRAELGLPALSRHTFDDGLDRLYLGYALPPRTTTPFSGQLPAGHPEGGDALALGCFSRFVHELDRVRNDVAHPKSPDGWSTAMADMLTAFLAPAGDEIEDVREVERAIGALHERMRQGAPHARIPIAVARSALAALLDDPARGGVPSGAVTFSAMSSMRNLPYRVICAIGLDDGAFPATPRTLEFDLMTMASRAGDRQRRDDDRNIFLDLLLSARERLYLSYAGRSIRDNSPLPPSVLIAELLDCLVPAIASDPMSQDALGIARRRLVVEHPLQAFSMDSFKADAEPRLRSFDAEYCEALKAQLERARTSGSELRKSGSELYFGDDRSNVPAPERNTALTPISDDEGRVDEPELPFFAAPLGEPDDEWRHVTLAQLTSFFRNPSRYLLERRLGVMLAEGDAELSDDEPFMPDWPGRCALAERLLPAYLDGADAAHIATLARAGTEYPAGRMGELLLTRELQHFGAFAQALKRELAEPCVPPIEATLAFDLDGQSWQLSGAFGDLRRDGLVRHRYDDARAGDYVAGWIAHLVLNALDVPDVTKRTTWRSRDGRYVLPPIADAREQLAALLALYRRGLRAPLHFFPKSAWAYMKHGESDYQARAKWRGGKFPEGGEPAYRLALRGHDDPLDAEFDECAQTLFARLLGCIDDPRLDR
jgi:exodeoxyribonuclease V gamma subunit